MTKNRSNSFKGVPVLGELAAIADGHQLHGAPARVRGAPSILMPNGDITPSLELLPWMVDLVDFIVQTVTSRGTAAEFHRAGHMLRLVDGHFWEIGDGELHSHCELWLGETPIRADAWLKPSSEGSEQPYISMQLIKLGQTNARASYWIDEREPPQVMMAMVNRLQRSLRHYQDWGAFDFFAADIYERFKAGEELSPEDRSILRLNGML